MKKYLFLILAAGLIAGCLSDTITAPQIVSRPVLAPGQVFYRCITTNGMPTLDLRISWNPSTVDTQQNFKGYFIKLFQSNPYYSGSTDGIDSVFASAIDSAHVPVTDTMYTFINKVVQEGRYTVRIWGERYPDPAKPDSLVLSQSYSSLSFNFDSRPVFAPKEIYASSASTNGVNLFWSQSPSVKQIGMAGYVIRYIDPTNSSAHLIYSSRPAVLSDTSLLLIAGKYNRQLVTTPTNTALPQEKEYTFWIKAIRKDSVESDDSISITWSGAESRSTVAKLDTGIYIGAANSAYVMQQTDPNGPALFQITQSGTNLVILGKNKTLFVKNSVQDSGLDKNYLAKPFNISDFTETQISASTGTIIYALFPGNVYVDRARLFITQDTGALLNTYQIQASFQPKETPQLPFF